jgi:hypothetical protein
MGTDGCSSPVRPRFIVIDAQEQAVQGTSP